MKQFHMFDNSEIDAFTTEFVVLALTCNPIELDITVEMKRSYAVVRSNVGSLASESVFLAAVAAANRRHHP